VRIRRLLRRAGCGLLLITWFGFLILVPCGVATLATGREIRLVRSDVPDDIALRIWLVQEPQTHGLGISTGYSVSPDATTVCTVTDTHFLLWTGDAAPSHSCACYSRQNGTYNALSVGDDACHLAGQ